MFCFPELSVHVHIWGSGTAADHSTGSGERARRSPGVAVGRRRDASPKAQRILRIWSTTDRWHLDEDETGNMWALQITWSDVKPTQQIALPRNRPTAERVPSLVTIWGTESDMLEVVAVVKQSLQGWKTHQRQTSHLIMDTGMLKIKKKTKKQRWREMRNKIW